jgi:hypothetical protein
MSLAVADFQKTTCMKIDSFRVQKNIVSAQKCVSRCIFRNKQPPHSFHSTVECITNKRRLHSMNTIQERIQGIECFLDRRISPTQRSDETSIRGIPTRECNTVALFTVPKLQRVVNFDGIDEHSSAIIFDHLRDCYFKRAVMFGVLYM